MRDGGSSTAAGEAPAPPPPTLALPPNEAAFGPALLPLFPLRARDEAGAGRVAGEWWGLLLALV